MPGRFCVIFYAGHHHKPIRQPAAGRAWDRKGGGLPGEELEEWGGAALDVEDGFVIFGDVEGGPISLSVLPSRIPLATWRGRGKEFIHAIFHENEDLSGS